MTEWKAHPISEPPEGTGDVLAQWKSTGKRELMRMSDVRAYAANLSHWWELPPVEPPPKVLDVEKAEALLKKLERTCGTPWKEWIAECWRAADGT